MCSGGGGEQILKKERVFRERKFNFSRFPGVRTVDSRRTKKQSCSTLQGLRVGTGFVGFRVTPGGRGFLLLDLILV